MQMYIPLHIRLTFFYALALGMALWFFSGVVYTQNESRAYQDLDNTLSTRAASVKLGKMLITGQDSTAAANPITLPSVDALGTGGVAIEVLDRQMQLLASTNGTGDPLQANVPDPGNSLIPWDRQAALQLLQNANTTTDSMNPVIYKNFPPSRFSWISYQGQRVRVYTLLNVDLNTIHIIQTARSTADIELALNNLRLLLLQGSILVMLLALGGGWFISWRVLSAVRHMSRTAQSISSSHDLSKRVSSKSPLVRDELANLAATFNQMLNSLEEAYQRQQRFVADASHELRAPITSIRCNLDLLAKASDLPSEEIQEILSDARTEAERMGRLVNDLLWLARSDETLLSLPAQTTMRQKVVDLDSLVLDVFRQYKPDDEQRRAEPRLTLQHTAPVKVYGDADQLKQAIVVLVDNALKYTPQEGYVSLALASVDRCASLQVVDTGIGIFPEDLPHIFERFYRANRARTRDRGGSGLGLAIAQSIAQTHQGEIKVVSIPGKGSTFTLKLPVVDGEII